MIILLLALTLSACGGPSRENAMAKQAWKDHEGWDACHITGGGGARGWPRERAANGLCRKRMGSAECVAEVHESYGELEVVHKVECVRVDS